MRFRKAIIALVVIAVLGVVPWALATKAAQQRSKSPLTESSVGWKITNAKVINGGETVNTDEGTIVSNYQLEAQATATSTNKIIPKGVFNLTLSAFSPNKDMIGQKKGKWYISGAWSIASSKPANNAKRKRHNSNAIQGILKAELDFNPISNHGNVAANLSIPTSTAAGRWGKGELNFSGNEKFEGMIQGNIEQWPAGKQSVKSKAQVN